MATSVRMNLHIMKGKSIAVANNAANGVEMHQMHLILFNYNICFVVVM